MGVCSFEEEEGVYSSKSLVPRVWCGRFSSLCSKGRWHLSQNNGPLVWAARLARSAPLPTALEYLVALTLRVYFCCCFLFLERLLFRQQPLRHYYHDQNGVCKQVMFTLMCLMRWLRHNALQPSFQTPRYCMIQINPFTPNIHLKSAKFTKNSNFVL